MNEVKMVQKEHIATVARPSDFAPIFPCCSVSHSGSLEALMKDLMAVLAFNGDEWRDITYGWLVEVEFKGVGCVDLSGEAEYLRLNLCRYAHWLRSPRAAMDFSSEWEKIGKFIVEERSAEMIG